MHVGHGGHAPGAVPICPQCGVVAPLSRTSCSVCNAPFAQPPLLASTRVGSAVLACIHAADFTCNACGVRSPLATVDCDGEAECMGCGLRQAFDAVQWTDALTFAHGVADLSGPQHDHVSARSRHAKIGTEFTSSTKTQNTMIMDARGTRTHSLRTAVSPGHPLCTTCCVPLDIWLEGPNAKTRCPRCNDVAQYALPPNAKSVYAPIQAVLANEQRNDRPVARLGRTQAGVESIVCPQCGAGISAGAGSELVKCAYCNLAVRIPGTLARQQRRGALPKMDPFWVLLDGPSVGRQRLARGKSEDPDDGDDDDDDDHAAHAPPAPPHAWPPQPFHPAPGYAQAMAPTSSKVPVFAIVGMIVVVVLGALAVGTLVFLTGAADSSEPAPAPKATPQPTPKRR